MTTPKATSGSTPKAHYQDAKKVSDLTVEELREIIREEVLDCLGEMYEAFHPDLEFTTEFAAGLQVSIDAVEAGEPTIPAEEVAKGLRLNW